MVIVAPRTATDLESVPKSSHGDDQKQSLPTEMRTPSYIISPSYSAQALLSHPESFAENNPTNSSGDGPLENHMKLWDEAYDELKRLDPELVKTYEKILSQDYEITPEPEQALENVIEQDDRTRRRSQMDRILRKVLLKTSKPAGVEGKVTDAIDVVLSLKEVIGNSLQPVPIAALAWTGVCIGLQVSKTQAKFRVNCF